MRDFKAEQHVVISDDRTITVPKDLRKIAVQFDHNVETVTFDCPRYWDGIDMSKMTVYVNYMRADRNRGMCLCKNVTVDEKDDTLMHFTWTLTRNATLYNGKLIFLVCIKNLDGDGMEINHWNSELCDQMQVSEGLECEETVMEMHQDIVTDLLLRMDKILIADAPILDKTLTERGLAADAKATGDAISRLREDTNVDLGELEAMIANEFLERRKEVAVERARIDKFVALEEGSTTGDAELMDARIGANGIEYPSVGHANRDQFNELYNVDMFIAEELGVAKPLTYELANVGNGTDGHIIYDSIYRGAFVKVHPGQVIRVSASGWFNRFSFAFCNSIDDRAESLSVAVNSFTDDSDRYTDKVIVVPDGYNLMLISLFVSNSVTYEFNCDLKIYDITAKLKDARPAITRPEVMNLGGAGGALTKKLVYGFFIQTKPNTNYKVTIRGEHNRCYCYGADEVILGKPGTTIKNLGFVDTRTLTEVVFENPGYNYVVFTIAYTGEGFEPSCEVEVYENYDKPVTLNGIEIQPKLKTKEDADVSFYKAGYDVDNVGTTAEVYALYDALKDAYPDYVSKNLIGKNSLGTDIFEYVFSNGRDYNDCTTNKRSKDDIFKRPTILIVSGVHGYERSAVMSTYSFAKDLCTNASNLEAIRTTFCIKIVPVVTPYSFDNDSRGNENGVNIARNFDADWMITGVGTQDYSGKSVADQLETQAIQAWIDANDHAFLMIDHHNSGYANEVSYLAGNASIIPANTLRECLFYSTDSLTEYWTNDIGIVNPYTIFAYTGFNGNFATLASAYNYATKIGVQGVCLETSWNQNGNFGMHSKQTIGVGAEILGNFIRQFVK